MRILVFSDSHGDLDSMLMAAEQAQPFDTVVHLGDGLSEFDDFCRVYKLANYCVIGNNDFGYNGRCPNIRYLEASGKKLMLTHGHLYKVKQGLHQLASKANQEQVDVVLYGHTHVQSQDNIEGIKLINPGSISRYGFNPSYAILDIKDNITVDFYNLK